MCPWGSSSQALFPSQLRHRGCVCEHLSGVRHVESDVTVSFRTTGVLESHLAPLPDTGLQSTATREGCFSVRRLQLVLVICHTTCISASDFKYGQMILSIQSRKFNTHSLHSYNHSTCISCQTRSDFSVKRFCSKKMILEDFLRKKLR